MTGKADKQGFSNSNKLTNAKVSMRAWGTSSRSCSPQPSHRRVRLCATQVVLHQQTLGLHSKAMLSCRSRQKVGTTGDCSLQWLCALLPPPLFFGLDLQECLMYSG